MPLCASASRSVIAPGSARRLSICVEVRSRSRLGRIRRIGKYPDCSLGKPTIETARAAAAALEEAVTLARRGELDAVVTGPVHKARMYEAGFKFPGQTEFFAERCGVEEFRDVLDRRKNHCRARDHAHSAERSSTRAQANPRLSASVCCWSIFLHRRSNKTPRIAVAGLNPHAGESGKIGREEIEIIAPSSRSTEIRQSDDPQVRQSYRSTLARHSLSSRG